jgi:mevalonate kinase
MDIKVENQIVYSPVSPCGGRGLSAPIAEQIESGSTCGKAIVVGEHAVVYGARAVAMPLHSMQVSLQIRKRHGLIFKPRVRMFLAGVPVSDHLLGIVDDAAELLGIKLGALDFHGTSSVLIGAGLGSSAAICVVVLKTLATFYGISLTPLEIATLATDLERRFHGNPSGLDTAVVSFEKVVSFKKGNTPVPIKITAPKNAPKSDYRSWRFAILDSSLRSSTLEMINQAKPWFTSSDQAERIAQFNDLADEVIDGFENGESSKIGSAMNSANELLDEAGLVPPKLTEIINIARECGAEGAKITGAGGGGCILALLDAANADLSLEQLKNQLGKNRVNEVTLL